MTMSISNPAIGSIDATRAGVEPAATQAIDYGAAVRRKVTARPLGIVLLLVVLAGAAVANYWADIAFITRITILAKFGTEEQLSRYTQDYAWQHLKASPTYLNANEVDRRSIDAIHAALVAGRSENQDR